MTSLGDRVSWIEGDLQTITAKLNAAERNIRTLDHQDELAALKRRVDDLREELHKERDRQSDRRIELNELIGTRCNNTDRTVGEMLLWLVALSAIAGIEAVAILLVWWWR